jgi:hypothetical protein
LNTSSGFLQSLNSIVSSAGVAFQIPAVAILWHALLHLAALCTTTRIAVFGGQEPTFGRQDALLSGSHT